mmetsp:Transcript_19571/g.38785  ORF Transcript_19571/g.38785 Transcript_19571/m.38785 type:complete len:219 (-) Transcript_19571:439-1095(-)
MRLFFRGRVLAQHADHHAHGEGRAHGLHGLHEAVAVAARNGTRRVPEHLRRQAVARRGHARHRQTAPQVTRRRGRASALLLLFLVLLRGRGVTPSTHVVLGRCSHGFCGSNEEGALLPVPALPVSRLASAAAVPHLLAKAARIPHALFTAARAGGRVYRRRRRRRRRCLSSTTALPLVPRLPVRLPAHGATVKKISALRAAGEHPFPLGGASHGAPWP